MTRKKFEEEIQRRVWHGEAARLPMKYHPRALMPCQVTRADEGEWEYVTTDNVRVRLDYRATFDNSSRWCDAVLEKECQELYKIPFTAIEAIWAHRIGRLDGMWNIVHLVRVDATEGI